MREWSWKKTASDPEWAESERIRKRDLERRKNADPVYRQMKRDWARADRIANPERHREHQRRYEQAHPDARAASFKKWREKNRDRIAWHSQKRRILMAGSPMPPLWVLRAIKAASGGRCAYCGRVAPLELEHIQPVTRGGTHAVENLTYACKSCNCSKHNKTLWEWWPRGKTQEEVISSG